jgi:protein gp37
MSRTGISWTDVTWNYWAGCNVHSPGCTNCYAMSMAARIERFGSAPHYKGTTRTTNSGKATWTGKLALASPAQRRKPVGIRRPSLIFTNSMSDYFHADAPDQWRLDMLSIMRSCPQHQFQTLTKRPENIAPFLERTGTQLPANFWAGATVERADYLHRIDTLRQVPARIRFLSIEPLLGPLGQLNLAGIQWVIIGGESGPGARPMEAAWVRDIIRQCQDQGVAVWFKQFGQAQNNPLHAIGGTALVGREDPHEKGGSTIDGRRWNQFPVY